MISTSVGSEGLLPYLDESQNSTLRETRQQRMAIRDRGAVLRGTLAIENPAEPKPAGLRGFCLLAVERRLRRREKPRDNGPRVERTNLEGCQYRIAARDDHLQEARRDRGVCVA